MNCRFIACNHGVQLILHATSRFGSAYCTQQTGGLTRGITLRAIHTEADDSLGQTGCRPSPTQPHNIACNTLTYVFARMGLPPHDDAPPRGRLERAPGS